MATGNFNTNMNFPLYVTDHSLHFEDNKEWLKEEYPEFNDDELYSCYMDIFWSQFNDDDKLEIDKKLEEMNSNLLFHSIDLKSGYYTGVQFYVEELHNIWETDRDGDYWYDNETCKYEFDLYRSQTERKFNSECNKITKFLDKISKEFGFQKFNVTARFSNGETLYEKCA